MASKFECMREVFVEGKRKFECLTCLRQLSSKQNILLHLHHVHDMSPVKRVKKLYMEDNELAVPVRTLSRWKQIDKSMLVGHTPINEQLDVSQSETGRSIPLEGLVSSEKMDHPVLTWDSSSEDSTTVAEPLTDTNEAVVPENLSSQSFQGTDIEESDISEAFDLGDDISSCDSESLLDSSESETFTSTDSKECLLSESDDCETPDLSDTESSGLLKGDMSYVTDELKALKIVSCFRRHNLTVSASRDLTETMKSIFYDSKNAGILNYEYLMSFIGQYPLHEFHYCENCTKVFPDDPDDFKCQSENCEGYRYKGPRSKQQSKDRQPRKCFIVADIRKQFTDLLKSPAPVKRVKKLYMEDNELAVPVRTLSRWKQIDKSMLVGHTPINEQLDVSQSETGRSIPLEGLVSSEKMDHPVLTWDSSSEDSTTVAEPLTDTNEAVVPENLSSQSFQGTDIEESDISEAFDLGDDISSCDSESLLDSSESETFTSTDSEECLLSESDDCETPDLSDTESSGLLKGDMSYVTDELKALKIVSCFRRHNLTVSASRDLTETMKSIFYDSKNAGILNYEYLMSFIGQYPLHEFHYCENCTKVFPDDPDDFKCQSENCEGYRYKGPRSKQQSKDRQPRKCFIVADIRKQFTDLLKSPGVMEDIHKQTTAAKSRNELNEGIITDITDGSAYRKILRESHRDNEYMLTALLNTDGVNLYSSSKVELWPIFLAVNELNPTVRFSRQNLLLVGIWQGKGKPPFQPYLKSVGFHLESLYTEGLNIAFDGENITVKIRVVCGVFDLPAKAAVNNMMYFNGQFGCITCEEPGQTVKQGKGTTRCYPDRKGQYKLRTHDEVVTCMMLGTSKKPVKGFKGFSGLTSIKSYNLVEGTVPDYMHGGLLGVTNRLMSKWFSPTQGGKEYYIGKELNKISRRLLNIHPPPSIERLPRDLEKHYKSLKATELQAWLLFYGIPCLMGILPMDYLNHFSYLSEAIYILLGDNITQMNLQRAQYLLDLFYSLFTDLYGPGSCGLNVHNTCVHLVYYVKLWGPLWAWSCFSFEDNNAMLLQAVHGTGVVTKQVMWCKQVQAALRSNSLNEVESRAWKKTYTASNCDVCGKMVPFELAVVQEDIQENLEADDQSVKIIDRVSLQGQQFSSSRYTRMKKRACSYVSYDEKKVGFVRYFALVTTTDTVYAVLDKYEPSKDIQFSNLSAGKHIVPVKRNGNRVVIAVDRLIETLVYMKVCQEVNECVVLMPSRHGRGIFK